MRHIHRLAYLTLLPIALAACNGGGGDSAPNGTSQTPQTGSDSAQYSGTLFFSGDNRTIYKLEMSNGRQTALFNSDSTPVNQVEADASRSYTGLADGSLAVTFGRYNTATLDTHYFSKRYSAGNSNSLFPEQIDGEFQGNPRPSPNGQMLMLDWRQAGYENVDAAKTLRIFGSTGEVLAEYPQRPAQAIWLPDNRPLFVDVDGGIYIDNASFSQITRLGTTTNGALPSAVAALAPLKSVEPFVVRVDHGRLLDGGRGCGRAASGRLRRGASEQRECEHERARQWGHLRSPPRGSVVHRRGTAQHETHGSAVEAHRREPRRAKALVAAHEVLGARADADANTPPLHEDALPHEAVEAQRGGGLVVDLGPCGGPPDLPGVEGRALLRHLRAHPGERFGVGPLEGAGAHLDDGGVVALALDHGDEHVRPLPGGPRG